jgi:DNA-binding GntR family transcriptional regulator
MGIEFHEVTIGSREAIGSYIDERVRSEELAALVGTPLRAALLRTHASRIGQRMSLEDLRRNYSASPEEIREAVEAFERVGLLRVSGGEVAFQICPSEDLREAIRRWLE